MMSKRYCDYLGCLEKSATSVLIIFRNPDTSEQIQFFQCALWPSRIYKNDAQLAEWFYPEMEHGKRVEYVGKYYEKYITSVQ